MLFCCYSTLILALWHFPHNPSAPLSNMAGSLRMASMLSTAELSARNMPGGGSTSEMSRPNNLQRIAQKKNQVRTYTRNKKLEKLAVYSSCKVKMSIVFLHTLFCESQWHCSGMAQHGPDMFPYCNIPLVSPDLGTINLSPGPGRHPLETPPTRGLFQSLSDFDPPHSGVGNLLPNP